MLQTHQFTGNRQFSADGRFLLYQECTTPGVSPRLTVYLDGQPIGKLFPGDWIELDQVAARWEVYPDDAACSGVVVIGNGTIRSLRTMGVVEAAERSPSSAVAGRQYLVGAQRTGGAGAFACIGLVAGTEPLAVYSLRLCTGATCTTKLWRAIGGASAPITTRQPLNKISTGPATSAILHVADSASATSLASLGVTGERQFDEWNFLNARETEMVAGGPLIVLPGESLWGMCSSAAGQFSTRFEFERL